MTDDDLERDYRAALLRHLPRRDEVALAGGYELGRRAVVDGTSLLTLVAIHHRVLAEVLRDAAAEDVEEIASAAAEFLIESLATYDMANRRLHDSDTAG